MMTISKIVEVISFGNRHIIASFTYMGLGMILMAITPGMPFTFATNGIGCGGEASCPPGQSCFDGECCSSEGKADGKKCCDGEWIPEEEECCGDGSHSDCGCCGEGEESFAIINEPGIPCSSK
ncbi:MAG: hypothetical protein LBQ66_00125 [Planctomycetaceae bacterium]|nr:hypothetical protein [Planctomycetaceae bacterium]